MFLTVLLPESENNVISSSCDLFLRYWQDDVVQKFYVVKKLSFVFIKQKKFEIYCIL